MLGAFRTKSQGREDQFNFLFAKTIKRIPTAVVIPAKVVLSGMDKGAEVSPLMDRNGYEKVRLPLEDARADGAKQIVGDKPLRHEAIRLWPRRRTRRHL